MINWQDTDPSKHPGYQSWLMFASLIVTLVPFYHGSNRYLDATYVTRERRTPHSALMIDFIVLFAEGLLFFVLAMLVGQTTVFYTLLGALFIFDSFWVGFTRIVSPTPTAPSYWKWAGVNVTAAVALFISIWSNVLQHPFWSSEKITAIAALGIAIGRSFYDYYSVWSFYYPGGMIPAPPPAPPPPAPAPAEPLPIAR